jgi:serine/threonine protein kinase
MRSPGPIGGDLLARRYRLIDRVGAGGMSVVWRARDEVLDRLVAVKWLGSELADDDLFRDLVRREAWATARIKHPAVAAVYDYGEVSGLDGQSRAYVVMEMLDGDSLAARLRRGPIPWREAIAIGAEVADALATAHENGVVHRDLSPDNVMLTSSGLRVFDFGIAAPVGEPDDDSTGSTFGTPAYVAPERLDGLPAQTATDVYCLGVLMFEMLTGVPPFPEDTWNPDAPLTERPAPRPRGVPGLPAAVARLVQRCLTHDPAGRPPARAVTDRLTAYARPWWRGPAVLAAAAAPVVAAAVVLAFAGWLPSGQGTPATSAPGPVAIGPPGPSSVMSSPSDGTPSDGTPSDGTPSDGTPSDGRTPPPAVVSTVEPSLPVKPAAGAPPPVAAVPVEQALDALRLTIDSAVPTGLASDIALDLRNAVEDIARKRYADPTADVTSYVDKLRQKVLTRATERDANGNLRMSEATRVALITRIDDLRLATTAT